ncbi:MAG: sensor histidine kinase, partial [Bacteroidetes bacterium]|nr:sensor histidine kinase [Bacteroidota bacterium]
MSLSDSLAVLDGRFKLRMNLSYALSGEKKYSAAIKILLEQEDYTREKKGIIDQLDLLLLLAENNNYISEFNTALKYLAQANGLMKSDSVPKYFKDIYEEQSIAYVGLGQYQNAFESHRLFKQISDRLVNEENLANISEMQIKYDAEKKDLQIKELNIQKKGQQKVLGLVALAGIIFFGFLLLALRSRKLQKKIFTQKEVLFIKQKELETNALQQKMNELEQMALRAQMNPHFIFNSLNSVQHFVMNRDVEGVNKYLGAFAHLIRQTLNNSGKQLISLNEEIKYLETYLSLEKMKSNNGFSYSINISESVDGSSTFIPGMILQPFVENSIRHGVAHKERNDGQISIHISQNGK